MSPIPRLTVLALIFAIAAQTFAQTGKVQFHHLPPESGLSQASVQCMAQDSIGFLWFGTEDGLNRFDGYHCTVFRHDPLDSTSISDNYIWRLLRSRSGDIWIGTLSGGLDRYEIATGRFMTYCHDESDPTSLAANNVTGLYEDPDGTLWVGTWGGGLCRLDPGSKKFVTYRYNSADRNSLTGNFISSIRRDAEGNLWVGTWHGLTCIDRSSGRFTRYNHSDRDPRTLSNDMIWDLYIDSHGDLWIATRNGLNRFDASTGSFTHYLGGGNRPAGLNDCVVSTMMEDSIGRFWVGTFENGVFEIDRATGKIVEQRSVADASGGSVEDDILSLLEDRSGAVWFGTSNGVSCYDPHAEKFELYSSRKDGPGGLSNVRSVCVSRSGGAWVGMNGRGVARLLPGDGSATEFLRHESDPGSLSSDHVLSVLEQRDGTLWAGTLGHGLNRRRSGARRFDHFVNNPADPHSLSDNTVIVLLEDRDGVVWAGTNGGGLNRFDEKSSSWTSFRYTGKPGDISGNWIWSLFQDSRGVLWVGTWTRGLDRYDPRTGEFEVFLSDTSDPVSISNNSVLSVAEDHRGFIWIGTHGGGVNRFDPGTRRFTHFTEADGLPNNVVLGVLPDRQNNVWLSTNRGLSKLTPATGEFRTFDVRDGLQGNEFDHGATCLLSDGRMAFGGAGGLNVFDPDSIASNGFVPPVVVTGFSVFDEAVRLPRPVYHTERIDLSYTQNFFSFDFAALSFSSSSRNRYMYTLEGLDRDWINAGTRRIAYYTHIPPGEYLFRVRGSNNDGVWNNAGASVRLVIAPPFWETIVFRGGAGALLIASVLLIYRRRIRGLEKEHRKQEEFSLRLMDSQEGERKRIAGELHDSLGQDLLVIRNRALLGLKEPALSPRARGELEQISNVASGAINSVREISYGLRPYQLDRLGLAKALRSITSDLPATIHFSSNVDPVDGELEDDQSIHLYRIVQEGVNNVLKHSGATEASVNVALEARQVRVTIADNGKGIPSVQPEGDGLRKGIGLSGIAERAKALGGTVHIVSSPGKGTTLTVLIPRKGETP